MDGFPLWLDQLWPWHTRALFLRSHDEIIDSTARPGHPGFACYILQRYLHVFVASEVPSHTTRSDASPADRCRTVSMVVLLAQR